MATWKKVVVSGSNGHLLNITASNDLVVSGTAHILGAVTLGTDLTVPHGGTGASSFTAGTVLLGSGADPITALAVGNTQIIIGDGSGDPTVASLSGDVSMTNGGVVSIVNDKVTTVKILNANVTTAKLNDGAVTTAKIGNDQVTGAKLANDITIAGNFAVDGTTALGNGTADTVTILGNVSSSGTWALGNGTADYVTVVGNITGSGNISSSVTSTGSFGILETPTGINFTDDNSSNQGAAILFTNASSQDKIIVTAGTRNMLEIHNPYNNASQGEVVVNEDSLDIDFRVESTDKTYMLYVDSENNRVGIGAGAEPGEVLEVVGNISASGTIRAGAGTTTGFIGTASFATNVVANGVNTAAIADEQVTLAKLAHAAANTVLVRDANSAGDPEFLAVGNTEILIGNGAGFTPAGLTGDVSMTNAGVVSIVNDKVITAKILNANVTTAKIADDAITTVKILNANVTTAKINDGAVTTGKIGNDQVTGAKLADNITIAGNFEVDGTTVLGDNTADHVTIEGNVTSSGTWALGNGTADYVTILGNITSSGTTALGNGITDFITMAGNLTGSAAGTISQSRIITDEVTGGSGTTGLTLTTNVTASGEISASLGFVGDLVGTASFAASIAGTALSDGTILIGDTNDVAAEFALTGDVTMTNGGVTTLVNDKVITAKILNANVTTAKIANSAVTTAKLNDGAVTTAKIGNDQVTGDKLANDITIANDLTVTGDLIVNGDTTQLSVTNLNVDDQFILLNSGSNSGDGGIIIQTGGAGGTHIGAGLGFDDSLDRWVISSKDQIAHNATTFAPNAQGAPQMLVAVSASASPPNLAGNPTDFGASAASRVGMMHVETDTGDIYIFS